MLGELTAAAQPTTASSHHIMSLSVRITAEIMTAIKKICDSMQSLSAIYFMIYKVLLGKININSIGSLGLTIEPLNGSANNKERKTHWNLYIYVSCKFTLQ